MSLRAKYNFQVKKRTTNSLNSENCDPGVKIVNVKRKLFQPNASPKKLKNCAGNENIPLKKCHLNLTKHDVSSFVQAKQAFHTGLPSRLVGRDEEMIKIRSFICEHLEQRTSGSMYISGAPGTGKTSSLMSIMQSIEQKFKFAFVNCMTVNSASDIYKNIAEAFKVPSKTKNLPKSLQELITSSGSMHVLVLDEIDHLDSKGQEILYNLFEWPQICRSTLILIGIANALDLTDRVLPRLHAFHCQPYLIHFQPYTKDQIVSVLEDRLSELQNEGGPIIQPIAIQLCARKIAACTGDIRKALDICRRAIELVESKLKKQMVLNPISDDRSNPGSPMKSSRPPVQSVDVGDISSVLNEVYGSKLQKVNDLKNTSQTVTMPLQHMLLICTVILMKKHCKVQDMTLGKVYSIYKRICKKRDIAEVSECSFPGLCKMVESRGFIEVKSAKIPRMSKIILRFEENEAEDVIHDKAMLPSILADRSVLHS
ncbi:cell division control protein 6 homolog [Uloborus diversus]|uniref:cell division control protein 6 homolog n=1 Tax=Uloborus diversus TaxID=327109 RepID=UPI00240954EC|nr:cell division control protein 6 homolog [Uloborus diversus]